MINYKCFFRDEMMQRPQNKIYFYIDTQPCYFYYYSLFQVEGALEQVE